MASIFTKIINREIPAHFIWEDEQCVAFADISPLRPGHVLLVPKLEVENFWQAPAALVAHLAQVAQLIARAQLAAFGTKRSAQLIAGFDVPHLHLHLIPADSMADLDLSQAQPGDPAEIQTAMERLAQALREQGQAEFVPAPAN